MLGKFTACQKSKVLFFKKKDATQKENSMVQTFLTQEIIQQTH